MEILFLGTGSGVPAKHRNVSSLAVKLLNELNEVWLFDCGEATQHQILHTTLKPRKVTKIFISHLHGDHIFGLPGFLSSRAFQGGEAPLTIFGPPGIKNFVLTSLKISYTHIKYPIHIEEFKAGDILMDDNNFKVTVKKLKHGVPSFGFRIEEKDKEGSLDAKRLIESGVPSGPLFGRLKKGEKVELEDGRIIDGLDFIGPKQRGRVLTILGDTKPCSTIYELAKNADVLVHEGTFAGEEEDLANSYNHSTIIDAARQAKKANVKKLLVNHISSRYLFKDVFKMEQAAQTIFPNTSLMHDFQEVNIPPNEAE